MQPQPSADSKAASQDKSPTFPSPFLSALPSIAPASLLRSIQGVPPATRPSFPPSLASIFLTTFFWSFQRLQQVHSAQKMAAFEDANGILRAMAYPDNHQGYGRVQLDQVGVRGGGALSQGGKEVVTPVVLGV